MLCQVACRVLRSECESVNCEHRTACTQPWIGALHRRDMGATTGLKSYERLLTRSSTLLSTCVYCIYVRAAAAGALTRGEWSNGLESRVVHQRTTAVHAMCVYRDCDERQRISKDAHYAPTRSPPPGESPGRPCPSSAHSSQLCKTSPSRLSCTPY